MNIFERFIRFKASFSQDAYIKYLRNKGVKIGERCFIPKPRQVDIDLTRPSLVEIGDDVRMNIGFTLLTHDFASAVFRIKYKEFIGSSGKVKIGNNVYFARHCTVLRGVTIGDNCIIGYGSLVTKSIPSNSVAVGSPAKVICTLDDYYDKRKRKRFEEIREYAQSIVSRYNRIPCISDFFEEFPYFIEGKDCENEKWKCLPIRFQLGLAYNEWKKNHKAQFSSFEDFLSAVLKRD